MATQEVTELRNIAKLLAGRGDIALGRRLKRIASMVESLVQPRNKAEVHITGLLYPLLRHLIYLSECQARGIECPEQRHWEAEVASWVRQIRAMNVAPKLKKHVYFSAKELDAMSEEIVAAVKATVHNDLRAEGFDPAQLTSNLLKHARVLSDFEQVHPEVHDLFQELTA